jgi:hypothetical protein
MMSSEGSSPSPNRRRHERVAKAMPVHVRRGQVTDKYEARIVNISAGGVLIETSMPLATNDLLTIDLDIAGEKEPIYVYGTVVRNDARGVGVSFVRISEITSDLINYLIRKWQKEGAHTA